MASARSAGGLPIKVGRRERGDGFSDVKAAVAVACGRFNTTDHRRIRWLSEVQRRADSVGEISLSELRSLILESAAALSESNQPEKIRLLGANVLFALAAVARQHHLSLAALALCMPRTREDIDARRAEL